MKQTIGVFFGGKSTEHDISIITALSSVIKPLRSSGQFTVVPIYITKDGEWYSDEKLTDISLYSSGKINDFVKNNKKVAVELGNGMTLVKPGVRSKRVAIDVAFPAMHGTYGEDGSLMGLLRMANIPFVGCDMDASVIAMDKVLAKQVAKANDILTATSIYFTKQQFETQRDDVLNKAAKLRLPVFVKPAHLGSSIGISRVTKTAELANAIEVAAHYDELVLVEEAVENLIEVTVPVMGNDEPIPALVERPNSAEFFDFDTKYIRGGGKKQTGDVAKGAQGYSEIPAKIPAELYDGAIAVAMNVYKAVGCSGLCRVDLLIDSKTKHIYFNELNPLPGSLYAHNWQRAGVSPIMLVTKLINFAVERFEAKQKLESSFSTSFLRQF